MNISEKIQYLFTLMKSLDEKDKNNAIDLIKNQLKDLTKMETSNLEKRRQRIIKKALFPKYWLLMETINNLDDENLSNLEKNINNNLGFDFHKV